MRLQKRLASRSVSPRTRYDIRVIQIQLGHSKLDTAALNARVAMKAIRAVTSPLERLRLLMGGCPARMLMINISQPVTSTPTSFAIRSDQPALCQPCHWMRNAKSWRQWDSRTAMLRIVLALVVILRVQVSATAQVPSGDANAGWQLVKAQCSTCHDGEGKPRNRQ
jgi:hypothetical protein